MASYAAASAAAKCYAPGVVECVSPLWTVDIDTPGLYGIALPLFYWCDCAFLDCEYFLAVNIATAFPETQRPDLVTDEFPTTCASYNSYGFGWEDLVAAYGLPGNIVVWADIICCDDPLASEPGTWGSLKQLYR